MKGRICSQVTLYLEDGQHYATYEVETTFDHPRKTRHEWETAIYRVLPSGSREIDRGLMEFLEIEGCMNGIARSMRDATQSHHRAIVVISG
jgi:hypothetical protein